jgi:soluble lytic murein transglycosylase-like protein
MAGRDYRIDPDLLRAISWQESKWVVDAVGKNREQDTVPD